MNVDDLEGAELDLAVARAIGLKPIEGQPTGFFYWTDQDGFPVSGWFEPSTDHAVGGPIAEAERIDVEHGCNCGEDFEWRASAPSARHGLAVAYGDTSLVARMRALVAAKQEPQ